MTKTPRGRSRGARRWLLLTVAAAVLCPQEAFAYLDPGTGSYVLQIVLATVFGALFFFKNTWARMKNYIIGLLSRKGDGE